MNKRLVFALLLILSGAGSQLNPVSVFGNQSGDKISSEAISDFIPECSEISVYDYEAADEEYPILYENEDNEKQTQFACEDPDHEKDFDLKKSENENGECSVPVNSETGFCEPGTGSDTESPDTADDGSNDGRAGRDSINITVCDSLDLYIDAVSGLTSDYADNENDGELIINLDEKTVSTGSGKILDRVDAALSRVLACDTTTIEDLLKKTEGYEIREVSENRISISDPYKTLRLLVTSDAVPEMYGAVEAVCFDDQYVLQYATRDAAVNASEKLGDKVQFVGPDLTVDILEAEGWEDRARDYFEYIHSRVEGDSSESPEEPAPYLRKYNSWAVPYLGIDAILDGYDTKNCEEVIVAVIDSGFDFIEGYFDPERILEPLTISSDGATDDVNPGKHGTFIAGQIYEATPDNVKILPVRAFNERRLMYLSTLEAATLKVVNYIKNIDVVNLSVGTEGTAAVNQIRPGNNALFERLNKNGTVCVASSGNSGVSVQNCYPAKSPYTLSISAIDKTGEFAQYSNYGIEGYPVDYCAPGDSIRGISKAAGEVTEKSGTSMAAPCVSAIVAILKSYGKMKGLTEQGEFINYLNYYVQPDLTEGTDTTKYGNGCLGFPMTFSENILTITRNGMEFDSSVSIEFLGELLLEGRDYSLSFEETSERGVVRVVVNGNYLYSGIISKEFDFILSEIGDCEFSYNDCYVYTGGAIEPAIRISDKGTLLRECEEYCIRYMNNVDPGTADITITGIGLYAGEKVLHFIILKAPAEKEETEIEFDSDDQFNQPELYMVNILFNGSDPDKNEEYYEQGIKREEDEQIRMTRIIAAPTGCRQELCYVWSFILSLCILMKWEKKRRSMSEML